MRIRNVKSNIPGQQSIFAYLKEPPKFNRAEWLRARGFKNIYDEKPPKPGLYEWTDIETPTTIKLLEYTANGNIHLGRLAMGSFRACWWREVKT